MSRVIAIGDRAAPCAHCGTSVVWLPTTYGSALLFEAESQPLTEIGPEHVYVWDRGRHAMVNLGELTDAVIAGLAVGGNKGLVRHRCEEYRAWRADQDMRINESDLRAWGA